MAVTLTVQQFAVTLRIVTTAADAAELPDGQVDVLTRLLATASTLVTGYAPGAPDAIANEAVIRLGGYLYDVAPNELGQRAQSPLYASGASGLLADYRTQELLGVDSDTSTVPVGIPTEGGLTAAQVQVLIDVHAELPNVHHTPPTTTDGVDQTARDAAAAQATALATHAGDPNAHHTPPTDTGGGGVLDVVNGRLPAPAAAMRLGWSQTQTAAASVFVRANEHPVDGASVGDTDGLESPPFPPALVTDTSLYLHVWIAGSPTVEEIQGPGIPTNITANFSDGAALTVDGVAGTWYVSNSRYFPARARYRVLLVGPLIATEAEIAAAIATHAGVANAHHTPPDVGAHIDQTARDAAAAAQATAVLAAPALTDHNAGDTVHTALLAAHNADPGAHPALALGGGGGLSLLGTFNVNTGLTTWQGTALTLPEGTSLVLVMSDFGGHTPDPRTPYLFPYARLTTTSAGAVGNTVDPRFPLFGFAGAAVVTTGTVQFARTTARELLYSTQPARGGGSTETAYVFVL